MQAGDRIGGRYEIVRPVVPGPLGARFEAEHLPLAKRVVIEVLSPEVTVAPELVDEVFRQVQRAAALGLEHVVGASDCVRSDAGEPCVVSEPPAGEPLAELIAQGRLTPFERGVIIHQLCTTMHEVHRAELVHGFLSPRTVLIRGSGDSLHIGITALGLAPFIEARLNAAFRESQQPDAKPAGELDLDLFRYQAPDMPPTAGQIDSRADIWSLGAIAFSLFTGRPLFPGDDLVRIGIDKLKGNLDITGLRGWGMGREFGRVVGRALEPLAVNRYSAVNGFAQDLYLCGLTKIARPPRLLYRGTAMYRRQGEDFKGAFRFTCGACRYKVELYVGRGGFSPAWRVQHNEAFVCRGCRSFMTLPVLDTPANIERLLADKRAAVSGYWGGLRSSRREIRSGVAELERALELARGQYRDGPACPTCGPGQVAPLKLYERMPCPRCGESGKAAESGICWD